MIKATPKAMNPKFNHIPVLHESTLIIAAMNWGPRKGDRMIAVDQMLIFRGRWWKKKTSFIQQSPLAAPATQNVPFKILDAMYDSKLLAAADQAAVPADRQLNQNSTGRRPK